jgi:hypothetical protein
MFEHEDILIEKVQSGEYGWREYIYGYSREMLQEYERYCAERYLDKDLESSATLFIEDLDREFNESLEND